MAFGAWYVTPCVILLYWLFLVDAYFKGVEDGEGFITFYYLGRDYSIGSRDIFGGNGLGCSIEITGSLIIDYLGLTLGLNLLGDFGLCKLEFIGLTLVSTLTSYFLVDKTYFTSSFWIYFA